MNKIHIMCHGGFGNRFFALIFGLYIAKKLNYTPVIIWPINNWCSAKLSELFETSFEETTFDPQYFLNNEKIINIMHDDLFKLKKYTNVNSIQNFSELKLITNNKDIFYFNNVIPLKLVENVEEFFEVVKSVCFKKELITLSENIIKQKTDKPFFGIHLRKTDFFGRSDFSESYCFNLVKSNPEAIFFICSDDPETENKFLENKNVFSFKKNEYVKKLKDGDWGAENQDEFGNITHWNVNRSANSVQNAIVDLLILSKSTIISPDVGSTFMHTAILLGKTR